MSITEIKEATERVIGVHVLEAAGLHTGASPLAFPTEVGYQSNFQPPAR